MESYYAGSVSVFGRERQGGSRVSAELSREFLPAVTGNKEECGSDRGV